MQALKSQTALRRGGIVYLRTDELTPNPVQPRKRFDDESLEELSGSIKSYGILNPLTVRLRCGKYELVAGERRLRAAKLAGLEEVPCILIDVNMEDASLIALVENLQRRDLDFIEDVRVRSAGSHLRKVGHEHVCRFFEFFLRLHHYHFNFFDV